MENGSQDVGPREEESGAVAQAAHARLYILVPSKVGWSWVAMGAWQVSGEWGGQKSSTFGEYRAPRPALALSGLQHRGCNTHTTTAWGRSSLKERFLKNSYPENSMARPPPDVSDDYPMRDIARSVGHSALGTGYFRVLEAVMTCWRL